MDRSDCSEQTLDDFSVLYTSPNVGSAYKRICFQSILHFLPSSPDWSTLWCSWWWGDGSAHQGAEERKMKEGLRRLSAALQEDHYSVERDLRRCFTLCASAHTHVVSFSFSADANALTHVAALQHSNSTNTLKFYFHSESFSVRRLNPVGKCHMAECCRVFSSPVWIPEDQTCLSLSEHETCITWSMWVY